MPLPFILPGPTSSLWPVTNLAGTPPILVQGGGWTPADLYQTGDILLWYDPSDLTTMFQDTAGTTPVTADGQSVALIRDKGPGGYHRTQGTGPSMPKYKTDGTLHWLLYDGSDDSDQTSAINWGTDAAAICAGLTKSSDAAQACFLAMGLSGGTAGVNNEQALLLAPGANGAATYYARFSGSLTPTQATASGYTAPHTGVITAKADISADLQSLRANAAAAAVGSGDMGTGNFGTGMILYFGRRGGATLPFNGREYNTVIRSRLWSEAEQAEVEAFIAAKSGVTL